MQTLSSSQQADTNRHTHTIAHGQDPAREQAQCLWASFDVPRSENQNDGHVLCKELCVKETTYFEVIE